MYLCNEFAAVNSPSNLPFPLSFHLSTALLIMVIVECFCVLVLLGRFAVVRRCGLLSQTELRVLLVDLLVCHDREPCKNRRIDRDAAWIMDSSGPEEPCTRLGSRYHPANGQF